MKTDGSMTDSPTNPSDDEQLSQPKPEVLPAPNPSHRYLADRPWVPFLAPLILYMLLGMGAPSTPWEGLQADDLAKAEAVYANEYQRFTTVRVAIMAGVFVWLFMAMKFPRLRISPLSIVVGIAGVVLWVGLHHLGIEARFVEFVGPENSIVGLLGMGPREAFNPTDAYGTGTTQFWSFVVVRFIALALIVPVIEELMLRGWLMRHVVNPNFTTVPFGYVTTTAIVMGTAFPMLYHPEKLASLVWFTMVTWLMIRTKNYWDCVAAHAVTNFLLGVYVLQTGAWELW